MRRLLLTMMAFAVLAGCQSGSRSYEPSECDPRATDSGRCVPGELPPEE